MALPTLGREVRKNPNSATSLLADLARNPPRLRLIIDNPISPQAANYPSEIPSFHSPSSSDQPKFPVRRWRQVNSGRRSSVLAGNLSHHAIADFYPSRGAIGSQLLVALLRRRDCGVTANVMIPNRICNFNYSSSGR